MFKTADLFDAHHDRVQVFDPVFRSFGARTSFHGSIESALVFEDHTLVKSILSTDGAGRVLVVDASASNRVAVVGDILAELAVANGWSGIVVNGCIRDSAEIASMAIGIRALGTHPAKCLTAAGGVRGEKLRFAGVSIAPGDWLYADADGMLVSKHRLVD